MTERDAAPSIDIAGDLAERIRAARAVVVFTGAGISAESGVPTYRGGGGTITWRGLVPTDLSSPRLLRSDPRMFWDWFLFRRGFLSTVEPNPGHRSIAQWEDRFESFLLVTQNVDGLHAKAGSRSMVELHGNIWRNRCQSCETIIGDLAVDPAAALPCCSCGGLVRPDVVLFGEALPPSAWRRACEAAMTCDLFVTIGTSAVVYPAAELPMIARRRGAMLIEVNPEETELTAISDMSLRGKAGEILPELTRLLFGGESHEGD